MRPTGLDSVRTLVYANNLSASAHHPTVTYVTWSCRRGPLLPVWRLGPSVAVLCAAHRSSAWLPWCCASSSDPLRGVAGSVVRRLGLAAPHDGEQTSLQCCTVGASFFAHDASLGGLQLSLDSSRRFLRQWFPLVEGVDVVCSVNICSVHLFCIRAYKRQRGHVF